MTLLQKGLYIVFKLGSKGYTMSLFDLCTIYRFEKNLLVKFLIKFDIADDFWSLIGKYADYDSGYAKITFLKNPVM